MSQHLEVCPLAELPPGQRRVVTLGKLEVLVLNVEGRCHAVQNRCPHASVFLEQTGSIRGNEIVCEWHGMAFDLETGESDSGFELPIFPIRIDPEGMISVEVPS